MSRREISFLCFLVNVGCARGITLVCLFLRQSQLVLVFLTRNQLHLLFLSELAELRVVLAVYLLNVLVRTDSSYLSELAILVDGPEAGLRRVLVVGIHLYCVLMTHVANVAEVIRRLIYSLLLSRSALLRLVVRSPWRCAFR